jgi:hypothetical protein
MSTSSGAQLGKAIQFAVMTFCSSCGLLSSGITLYKKAQIPPPDFNKFSNASCYATLIGGNQFLKEKENDLYCCNFAVTVTLIEITTQAEIFNAAGFPIDTTGQILP